MLNCFLKVTQPDFLARAQRSGRMQLLTLGFSHYVELARWSLQLKGIEFDEYAYVPGQHVLPVLSARIGGPKKLISQSSFMQQPDRPLDEAASEKAKSIANKKRSTAVPLALLSNGDALTDSWSIAGYSGLAAIDPELQSVLDTKLGPQARQYVYSFVLKESNRDLFYGLCTEGQSWWWRALWWMGAGKRIHGMLTQTLKPNDAELVARCREGLIESAAYCDRLIEGKKGKYLGGEEPGIADIAICALFAPLVLPEAYAQGKYHHHFVKLMDRDEGFKREVEYWSGTVTGQYCHAMYKELRGAKL